MELKDIVPKKGKIFLSAKNKEYELRPISIADEIWMNERFGSTLETVFTEGRVRDLAAIAFHQLEDADKRDFLAEEYTIIDENGEQSTMRLGGEKLFFACIFGPNEKLELYKALMQTIGVSMPVIENAATVEKKSIAKAQKKVSKDFGKRR